MKSIALFTALPICGGAIGYACGGTQGAIYGAAAGVAALIIAKLIDDLRREKSDGEAYYSGAPTHLKTRDNVDKSNALARSDSGNNMRIRRENTEAAIRTARTRRTARLTDGLSEQSARFIRRFWCYRTPGQTLLFVRLRAGKLYCMYMNRSGKGEGARWVVRKIEGEEYGEISEKLKSMAHVMD